MWKYKLNEVCDRDHEIITKTVHHAMNVLSTEAEIFVIRYGISWASKIQNITYIVVITDVIYIAKHIFNTFIYPQQLHIIAISSDFLTGMIITWFLSKIVILITNGLLIY